MSEDFSKILKDFLIQAQSNDLKKSKYPKIWDDLRFRISFGMGAPARVPWIAFVTPEMEVSYGFYPVYLYYKTENILILAYGVSETEEYSENWPDEIVRNSKTIQDFFGKVVPRYGDSLVFRTYKVNVSGKRINLTYVENNKEATDTHVNADLASIIKYYKQAASKKIQREDSPVRQVLFYIEKQLEDFLILNWVNTELGKRYDLIIEDGELVSQQFETDIGPIDILAKDKKNGNYVVIELKRGQTSDDTIGQLMRYMGWITVKKKDKNVKGIIIAGGYDQRLEYAAKMMSSNIEIYLYDVSFKLKEFSSE